MTARFIPSQYPGGRILLRSGHIDVGAVCPPAGDGTDSRPWSWQLWVTDRLWAGQIGRAKTELVARSELLAAWRTSLAAMGLREIDTPSATDDTQEA